MKGDAKRILVASSDAEERDAINEALSPLGYKTVLLQDGPGTIEAAIKGRPSAIIVDLELNIVDGTRVFHILRNNPNSNKIPFVFLADNTVYIKGFRSNIDILLLRPINMEELSGSISRLLLRVEGAERGQGDKEIEGRLSHISLVDLLQMLHLNRKEGILKVSSREATGIISIKNGEIYNAKIGEIEKEKALFRLLAWKDGIFEFIPRPVEIPKKIQGVTGNLLMEGIRQYDELEKIRDQLPDPDSLLKKMIDVETLPKGLKPSIREVLNLVEYFPKVSDLVDRCTVPDYDVYQALLSILQKGILKEEKGKTRKRKDASKVFLTDSQALHIRENIMKRWSEMSSAAYGKIMIASTSDNLISILLNKCKDLSNFSINPSSVLPSSDKINPFGEVGVLNLYGGMDIVLYALPISKRMQPLWYIFFKDSIGLILLWDVDTMERLGELAEVRNDLLARRRLPVANVLIGGAQPDKDKMEESKVALGIGRNEKIMVFDPNKNGVAEKLLFLIFDRLTKEEYVLS